MPYDLDAAIRTLLDPVDDVSDSHASPSAIRQRTMTQVLALLALLSVAWILLPHTPTHGCGLHTDQGWIATYQDGFGIRQYTWSPPVLSLLHQYPNVRAGLLMLTTFVTASALFYPVAVVIKPRPRFLHVAGIYLYVNAVSLCSCSIAVWSGCVGFQSLRLVAVFVVYVGKGVGMFLLQYCIILKVRALEGGESGALRKVWKTLTSKYNAIWLLSLFPHGLLTDFQNLLLMYVNLACIGYILVLLLSFTALSARVMLQQRSMFPTSVLTVDELDESLHLKLQRLLFVHATTTCLANGTTVWYLFTCGAVMKLHWGVGYYFAAHGMDSLFNTICALSLSGLIEAVCMASGFGPEMPEPGENDDMDLDLDPVASFRRVGEITAHVE